MSLSVFSCVVRKERECSRDMMLMVPLLENVEMLLVLSLTVIRFSYELPLLENIEILLLLSSTP